MYRIRNIWSDFVIGYFATLDDALAVLPRKAADSYAIECRPIGGSWRAVELDAAA
jgi:hypothetical protein